MALLGCFLVFFGPALRAQPSRDEVRAQALHTHYHGITAEIALERIGVEGEAALVELLADPAFPRRDNVVAFLGFLGDQDSTTALLGFLADPPAAVTVPEEDRALLLAPQSLGHIAHRGEPRALEALLQMTSAGSGAGPLAAAAARSPRPGALLDDLLEQALLGLAYARDSRATARLRVIERGAVRPAANGRDLRSAASDALAVGEMLGGGSIPAAASAGPQVDGDGASGPSAGRALASGDAGDLVTATALVPRDFDTAHSDVQRSLLTYANHPAVTNPMDNSRLDAALAAISLYLGRADFGADIGCCAGIARSGNALSFGSLDDGLDVIGSSAERDAVLNNSVARVKVVRAINYCAGPGTNIIGCAWVNGNGMALVRFGSVTDEGALWAHEYGHNVGIGHNLDSRYVMYGCLCGENFGLTQSECNSFHTPASGAQATRVNLGACTDNDFDDVQDQIDNCPGASNPSQVDSDGDGVGDVCQDGCGNDILDSGEECDVSQLGGATCVSQGYPGGTLRCRLDCQFEETDCIGGPTKTPTPTASATPTATRTPTPSHTPTASATATQAATSTVTLAPSATPTASAPATATPSATATLTATATASPTAATAPPVLDIDDDGEVLTLTDGVLVMRWLFGLTGDSLTGGAIDTLTCARCETAEIETYLASIADQLDIDGDGEVTALTDGVLILRWLFGFRGATLVASAVDTLACTRCTAEAIEAYLAGLD